MPGADSSALCSGYLIGCGLSEGTEKPRRQPLTADERGRAVSRALRGACRGLSALGRYAHHVLVSGGLLQAPQRLVFASSDASAHDAFYTPAPGFCWADG